MSVPSESRFIPSSGSPVSANPPTFRANSLQAVVFDAVGTVMYPEPSVAAAYHQALQQHCYVDVNAEQTSKIVRESLRKRSTDADLRTSEEGEYEFWANMIHQLCPESPGFQACFDHLFAHFENADHWRCFSEVADVLLRLEAAGLTIAIASNFDLRLNSVCDGLPPLAGVSRRMISSQIGWRKPARPFFEAVSRQLNLPPEKILMVGDDLQNDISGALAAGFSAAWICRDSFVRADVPDGVIRLASLSELIPVLDPDGNAWGNPVDQKANGHCG